jgi:hypothetical protein
MSSRDSIGVEVTANRPSQLRSDFWLFGEDQSVVVGSIAESDLVQVKKASSDARVDFQVLGKTTDEPHLVIPGLVDLDIRAATVEFNSAIGRAVGED